MRWARTHFLQVQIRNVYVQVFQRKRPHCKDMSQEKAKRKGNVPRHAKGGQRTHHIEEAEVSIVHTLSDTKGGPKLTLEVVGRDLELDVDTGASVTVLPRHVYSQYLKHVQLQKSKIALRSYSGQPLVRRSGRGNRASPIRQSTHNGTNQCWSFMHLESPQYWEEIGSSR